MRCARCVHCSRVFLFKHVLDAKCPVQHKSRWEYTSLMHCNHFASMGNIMGELYRTLGRRARMRLAQNVVTQRLLCAQQRERERDSLVYSALAALAFAEC